MEVYDLRLLLCAVHLFRWFEKLEHCSWKLRFESLGNLLLQVKHWWRVQLLKLRIYLQQLPGNVSEIWEGIIFFYFRTCDRPQVPEHTETRMLKIPGSSSKVRPKVSTMFILLPRTRKCSLHIGSEELHIVVVSNRNYYQSFSQVILFVWICSLWMEHFVIPEFCAIYWWTECFYLVHGMINALSIHNALLSYFMFVHQLFFKIYYQSVNHYVVMDIVWDLKPFLY